MKVLVDPKVPLYLRAFYSISMISHPSLSEEYVLRRIADLESHIQQLGIYAEVMHHEPYMTEWKEKEYLEYIYMDFHFAYKVENRSNNERFVHIYDVVNSRLNYNPEDFIHE